MTTAPNVVYRYHVIFGAYVRQPIDLSANPPEAGIDWLHVEPYTPPPLCIQPGPHRRRLYTVMCDHCGHTEQRKGIGNCRKCGCGWLRIIAR